MAWQSEVRSYFVKRLGTRKGTKPVKGAKDTQELLRRVEELLADSKRLQQQHAALSKRLKELLRRTEEH